jgi:signal transduction histidine kinase
MLSGTLIKGFDQRRLRNLLLLFFLALAAPTVVLIGQAYSQLKWEAFHQYRGLAEALTARIDARLIDMVGNADKRSFTDFAFLVVAGDPSANFVQRSVLSSYPVPQDLPGTLGYFQVDSDGSFSTPLLPSAGSDPQALGISRDEFSSRAQLAQQLQSVLADNRLVKWKSQSRLAVGQLRPAVPAAAAPDAVLEEEKEAVDEVELLSSARQRAAEPGYLAEETYSQQVFDQLNQPRKDTPADLVPETSGLAGALEMDDAVLGAKQGEQRFSTGGKVADLKLDSALQKKSEDVERSASTISASPGRRGVAPGRAKRLERSATPENVGAANAQAFADKDAPRETRIRTFESEIDPLEFSLLDSGHMVLFRKVWRDGERFIQGLVVDQDTFINTVVVAAFNETVLAGMSQLIVAYQEDVIFTVAPADQSSYPNGNESLDGTLLYRSRLSTPMDSLELIYSITRLPPGPGAGVLGWVTLVLALIFTGGFVTLYRLGVSQINLARQQQDFVSSVSHELKTPLTSIRMYGEMLKEGWADEEKKQSYYEFIHDESERLTRLISNVLQLARITRNEPQFDLRPIKVGELMSQLESKISHQVERAGFELAFIRDPLSDDASIDIDSDCFVQIIINLVDNAIKFSKAAATRRIEITNVLYKGDEVAFKIRDFGPGIPKDQMKKIFTLFYRTESELTRETVGTGIGLAIVHQLTLAMNAKIDVINTNPGAEFQLLFPIQEL